jgi:hypothetical protein
MTFTSMALGKNRGGPLTEVPGDCLVWTEPIAQIDAPRTAIAEELARRVQDRPEAHDGARAEHERAERERAERARAEHEGGERSQWAGSGGPSAMRPIARLIVQAGFRRAAQEAHPGHGGTDDGMRAVLKAKAALERMVS